MCKTVIMVPGARLSYVVARGIIWLVYFDESANCIRSSFGKYEVMISKSGSIKSNKFATVVAVTTAVVVVVSILVAVLPLIVPTLAANPIGNDIIFGRFGNGGLCGQNVVKIRETEGEQ